MAARFPSPHLPLHRRIRRAGGPVLTLVPALLAPAPPAGLAPVLPMPRPALRPVRLVLLSCPVCLLAADPMPVAEAEHLAGVHDDTHHGGRPTAELRTDPARAYTLDHQAPGPDLGGAA